MAEQPGRLSTWTLRAVVYGGAVVGVGLVVAAIGSDDPPSWWWFVGVPLALVFGTLAAIWISYRLQPEKRQRAIERMRARREEVGRPLERSRLAYRATKHKKAVLRSGVDATAVVTFLAEGSVFTESAHLVYLELDVTMAGAEPYPVKTGEFLNPVSAGSVSPGKELHVKVDPHDPQRVAVDWERSLRLTEPAR